MLVFSVLFGLALPVGGQLVAVMEVVVVVFWVSTCFPTDVSRGLGESVQASAFRPTQIRPHGPVG